MKYIYLDTSHLLKWHNGALNEETLDKLSMLTSSEEHLFVISDIHSKEINFRTDRMQLKNIRNFLNKLPSIPCVELAVEIFELEIIQAYKKFRGEDDLSFQFFGKKNESIPENDLDKYLLEYSLHKTMHEELNTTIVSKGPIIQDIMQPLDSQQFKSYINKTFKQRLSEAIKSSGITVDMDALINFIIQDESLTPSLKINIYTSAYLYRDKNKALTINDWFDILHCSAIPYVDYFSLDRESYQRLSNIKSLHNILSKKHISSNLNLLLK